MKKLVQNYSKPTPPLWRKLGDFALIAIPVIEAQWTTFPIEVNPLIKWSITTLLILFKLYSNTKVESNHYEGKV